MDGAGRADRHQGPPEAGRLAPPGAGRRPPAGGMFSEEGMKNLISQSSLSLPEGPVEPGNEVGAAVEGARAHDRDDGHGQDLHLRGPRREGCRPASKIGLDTKVTLEPAADSNVAVKIASQQGKGEFSFDNKAGRVVTSRVDDQMQDVALGQGAGPRAVDQTRHHDDDPGQAQTAGLDPPPDDGVRRCRASSAC